MQTLNVKINGMTCGGCVNSVTRALKSQSGVEDVKIDLASGMVAATYNEAMTTPLQLKNAIIEAGYSVDSEEPANTKKGGCCS